jgi:acetyl esterase/lipase
MASKEMQDLIGVMGQMMQQGGMPKFDGKINPARLRGIIEAAQARMPVEPGVACKADALGGIEAELCTPENAREDAIILYIHGGGLICGNAFTSRGYGSMLAGAAKIPVYTISYRLAPEHPYPAAVDDCFNAYADILKRHPDIPVFLIGESGGAYLSLTTTMKAKAAGLKLPAGIIPYSPPIDFSDRIDRSANEGKDITVTSAGLKSLRAMCCPDSSRWKDPYVSPLYGDYAGFPPMLLAWDAGETLAADSEKLVELAKAAGVEVQYKAYPGCFHAFATAGRGTPESAEVLVDTLVFIEKHIN